MDILPLPTVSNVPNVTSEWSSTREAKTEQQFEALLFATLLKAAGLHSVVSGEANGASGQMAGWASQLFADEISAQHVQSYGHLFLGK